MAMADVAFLLTIAAFFAVCVLYIRGCDRIIRRAEESDAPGEVAR